MNVGRDGGEGNLNGQGNGGGGNRRGWWGGLCVGLVVAGFCLVAYLAVKRGGEISVGARVDTPEGLGVSGVVTWKGV
jgi:hypothetical protein